MSLAYTSKTWTDYADSPCLEAVELNRIDSGIAAVTAELLALEAALPTTYQPISAELSALAALSSTGYAKRSGAAAWSVVSSIPQADVSGLTAALAGKEPTLGSPSTSGYLLSSTTAGVRSWVAPYTHPATHPQSVVDSASGWITTALAGKQAAITTGTTAQYLRGDLSLATFPTTWAGTALTGLVPDANIASAAAWNAKQAGSSVLTSIAAQSSGTGLLKLTAGVASLDSTAYQPVSGMSSYLTVGTAAAGYQPLHVNLTALSSITNGLTVANGVSAAAYFSDSLTGDTILRWGSPYTEKVRLGVMSTSSGSNASSLWFSASAAGSNYSFTAASFVKSGGTAAQFLKADGTVDASSYALVASLANYLPLAGGTMAASGGASGGVTWTDGGSIRAVSGAATKSLIVDTASIRLGAGSGAWDYAQWCGIRYNHDALAMYIGGNDSGNTYWPSNSTNRKISVNFVNLTSYDAVTVNGAKVWNAGNLTPTPAGIGALASGAQAADSAKLDGLAAAYFVQGTSQSAHYGVRTTLLGTGSAANANINQLTHSGFFDGRFVDSTQMPQAGWWAFSRIKHSDPTGTATTTWGVDFAGALVAENVEQYCVRVNTSSSWGAWRTLWHSNNLVGTRNEHNHAGVYMPLAGGTMGGDINLGGYSITSGSTGLGNGMVSSIGGNFTNLQVLSLLATTGYSRINLGTNLIPTTDSGANLGQIDKRLLATYSVYSYLSYLDASVEVAGPVMRWKDRIVIGNGGVLPIVGDGCAIVAVGQGTGGVTNKPATNNYQSVDYRKADGTLATAAAGGNVIDLDLYGRCAFVVGVSSSRAQLIL